MTSAKTLLTPEEQWKRTIQYVSSVPGWRERFTAGGGVLLWVVRTPHHLLSLGDVLVVTCRNGMNERYAMSGVSSKGARLKNYYVPLRQFHHEVVQLPGDLIDLQWDDPAVGRFVADLRASSRRRVGAGIPAPTHEPPPIDRTEGLRYDGCYRSRRGPRHKRLESWRRNYLRFFPDGTVIASPYGGFSEIHRKDFVKGPWDTVGKFTLEGHSLSCSILLGDEVVEQYFGTIDGPYLRLSRQCRKGWSRSREGDVYKFGPWQDG